MRRKSFSINCAHYRFEKRIHDLELLTTFKEIQNSAPKEGLINQVLTDLEGKDTTSYLRKIQCRSLLIHGKQDSFYQHNMNILKSQIPNNDFIEVDHCGHLLPMERPEAVSSLIELWLNKELH